MPVTHLVDKVACPRSVISAWSYAGHCSQETQSLSKVNLPTRKAAAETGCSKGTHGRNSKDPGVTEGISALAQDSAATPALSAAEAPCLTLSTDRDLRGRFSCRKSCGKALLANRKPGKFCCPAAWMWTNQYLYSYITKLITSDHWKIEVACVSFYAKAPWVIADQRIPSQGASLLKGFAIRERGFAQTPEIQLHCLSWCR